MTVQHAADPSLSMTREEYREWAAQQPRGRFERIGGIVVAMAPERIVHARVKARCWQALDRSIRSADLPGEALPDGVTVEVEDSDYEPDVVVQCGPLDPNGVAADNPIIIVEVLPPSTAAIDRAFKLREYFRIPSLCHYLIVWADMQQVVHHRRGDDGTIATQIIVSGEVLLDPPGIAVPLAAGLKPARPNLNASYLQTRASKT